MQAILAMATLGAITASAGAASSAVGVTPGPVVAWGANGDYSLGDGTNVDRYTPVRVSGLSNVIQLAGSGTGGGDASLALLADGTVSGWGYNAFAQLGDGTTTSRPTPVPVSGLAGVRAIAAGVFHGLALLSNGKVMAWGSNGSGQVGDGTTTTRLSPVPVSGISGAVAIAAGDDYSLAVLSNGTVMAWGANSSGQLGDGTTTMRLTPVPVSGLRGVIAVAGGLDDSFALLFERDRDGVGDEQCRAAGRRLDHRPPDPGSGQWAQWGHGDRRRWRRRSRCPRSALQWGSDGLG